MELKHVEPGWLQKAFESANVDVMVNYTPLEVVKMGLKVTIPPNQERTKSLYDKLEDQFYAWTGMTFEEYKRSDNGSENSIV